MRTILWPTATVHSDLNCGLHYGLIVYNINLVNAVSQCSNTIESTIRFDIYMEQYIVM